MHAKQSAVPHSIGNMHQGNAGKHLHWQTLQSGMPPTFEEVERRVELRQSGEVEVVRGGAVVAVHVAICVHRGEGIRSVGDVHVLGHWRGSKR